MTKFFNKKIFAVLALIALLVVLPSPSFVHADGPAPTECGFVTGSALKCINDAFEWIVQTIGYMLGYLSALLISWAAYFIQVMIGLSIHVMETPVVKQGFAISLSFANLGFTLAVIFIAFITIFRLQGYETKKLLRNLIVAAVLINFSFTFAGLIMDGSHVFSKFFLTAIAGDANNLENLTASIADSLNIHKLHNATPPSGVLGSLASVGAAYYKTLASLALIVFFNALMVITFFTIAGLMVIRYVMISILLIIMPFAWLCWIFPNLSRNWKQWWDAFLKWNIFLPVLLFFIYLSVLTSSSVGTFIAKYGSSGISTGKAAADFTTFGAETIGAIAQALVQVALLFGGMIAAQKLGIAGSDSIMKSASFVKNKIQGGVVSMTGAPMAYRGAKRVGGAAVDVAASTRDKAMGTVYQAGAWAAGKVRLHGLQSNLLTRAEAPKEAAKKAIKDRAEEIKKLPDSAFMALMQSSALTEGERAARATAIAQKGNLKDVAEKVGEKAVNSYMEAAGRTGVGKGISENRLDLAIKMDPKFDFAKKTADWGVEEWKKQKPESFASAEVMKAIDPKMLAETLKGKGGMSPKKLDAIVEGIAALAEKEPGHEMLEFMKENVAMLGVLRKKAASIEKNQKGGEEIKAEHKKILALNAKFSAVDLNKPKTTEEKRGSKKPETADESLDQAMGKKTA